MLSEEGGGEPACNVTADLSYDYDRKEGRKEQEKKGEEKMNGKKKKQNKPTANLY